MKIKPIDTELSKEILEYQEMIKFCEKLYNEMVKQLGIPKKYLKNEKK
jgi:hypothetical protein